MGSPQNDDGVASGESTPLLPAGAVAPPPSAAPPPPPRAQPQDAPGDGSFFPEETASLPPAEGEDVESQSQPSLTQSSKSGKSGRSRKRKRKKKSGDASSESGNSKNVKKKGKDGPQKSVIHLSFDAVRGLAIVASSLMLVMQILPLLTLYDQSTWLQIALRSYLVLFCLSFVLAESRAPFLQRIVTPHNNWILRGFLYSFIGLIGMEQDLAIKAEIAARTSSVLGPDYGTLLASMLTSITAWIMIGVGVLYTILGLLCMQGWYDRLERGHDEKVMKWKREREAEEDFRRQKEDQRRYEKDRREGMGEWYDDLES